jgi:ABC-type proline/glycine betaine transport system ATPase subunit
MIAALDVAEGEIVVLMGLSGLANPHCCARSMV